ncbi:GNAT family N-acetyltransferase [Chromobacterium sp. IIBBL 290-4]|uniref:GNAT family N-acetyltransferase n=1 Tax=Chromobacterium sp. IIBBL 290-4 TaxID=2953890 RepID=UPI0020B65E3A|nr:GNAT family N-acetyltransferase [Chromobacterium sp. IIBBL 290-4]UTH74857.1 GNAT family N-acetyltransferase [Chromobacterium sp. IIBBL 290-4]
MTLTRLATPEDSAILAELFYQIDLHYFGPERASREASARYARDNLFQPHCGVQIMLAERDGQPLGLATFSLLYPAPEYSGQLYMKDLFTLPEARGSGAGRALMRALAQLAVQNGCKRMDWTAERGNAGALEFYRRLGASIVEDKIYYRISGESLVSFSRPSAS